LNNIADENDSIRSAWDSDKRGYKNSLEVLQNQLEVSKSSENLLTKLKFEIENDLNKVKNNTIK
jgi:malate synthase